LANRSGGGKIAALRLRATLSATFSKATSSSSSAPFCLPREHSTLSCAPELPSHGGLRLLADHPNPDIACFFQKGFSEITDPVAGRAAHALCIRNTLKLSLFHSNTLVGMYVKFGDPFSALHVFDVMPLRNGASWNAVISGCVRAGLFSEAVELFREMRMRAVGVSEFVLASILSACNQSVELSGQGVQIHAFVIKTGLVVDVFVGTALLHLYGGYGLMSDVKRLFCEMPQKNVVSWTAFMVSFSKNGCPEEALMTYQLMRREGIICNENSFATVVSSCAAVEDERLGLEILAHIIVSGYEANVSVGNSLITLFGCLGKIEYSEFIFHRMKERDKITWNSIISLYSREGLCEETLRLLLKMQQSNIKPDSTTLSSLISSCQASDDLKWGRGLHAFGIECGLNLFVSVSNTLINMYSMCQRYKDAEAVFHCMSSRDLISWNSMIASYVMGGQYLDAQKLFSSLICMKTEVNHVTFASALGACACHETLFDGRTIHALALHYGLQENLLVGNTLITMYGKCNAVREAQQVFRMLPNPDVITWNALLGGLLENEERQEAMQLFNCMRKSGTRANHITIMNILGACCAPHDLLKFGMPLHAHAISTGFESDGFVKNSVLTMYSKSGDFDSSKYIFEGLEVKTVVSWNAMIASKAHHGLGEDALNLFNEMRHVGLEIDEFTLSGGLSASANLASLQEGQQLHCLMIKLGFDFNLHVINAAMDMYGKCGKMDHVLKLLPEAEYRSRQTWNILISGYARHGCFDKAKDTFKQMLQKGLLPDYVTFVSLLSACNHAGLVDEGLAYFYSMTSEFDISPGIQHCVCIVDLLGRSGRLLEAERFIDNMPVIPNDLIWRSLLSSSRIHRDFVVGRKAAERLIELDPLDDSAYVLLSNIYAVTGRWEDVENVRTHMKSVKLKKKPACSWIKVKNKVNTFGIGDWTHPQAGEIQAKLEEMLQLVKEVGYVPETTFELHDTDEEQKEQNLWNHSEKLALAFGLISLPEGSSITVFKNLRVCGDCHLVYKLISGILDREIILRDCYRFHHFTSGQCSCSDYW
ncbi:hypothetical protein Taro_035915, partial [Colocasia esculenta]|nr:hypothetical protein [Colocasia esculenta]